MTDTASLRNPHYRMPGDTLATLNLDFMTEVVRAAAVMVANEAGKIP
ncbi:MAG: hypothetical protein ACE5MI_10175 [Acidimicrobiia bacterium]